MASLVYNAFKAGEADGTIDLLTDTIKLMLVTSSYVANADDEFVEEGVNDANEHELDGTNYQKGFAGTGRETLANKVVTKDNTNDRAEFDNTVNFTFTAIDAGTAAAFIIYKHVTNDLASTLIAYVDTGGFPVVTNGGDLTITFNAEGILQLA